MEDMGIQGPADRGATPTDAVRSECDAWWRYARKTARLIADGVAPPPQPGPVGVVLRPNENLRLAAGASYARLYAEGDGSYTVRGGWVTGSAANVIGRAIRQRIDESRARAAAAEAAQVRWRDQQTVQFIATDHRIMCRVADRGWLDFWFDVVREFHPELENWALTLTFSTEAGPLRLQGPPVAGLIPWVAHDLLGDAWTAAPRLQRLLG